MNAENQSDPGDLTWLIKESGNGNSEASTQLYKFVYSRLINMARHSRYSWSQDSTLDTTSLVHEFFIKYTNSSDVSVNDRRHFFNLAATMMRQILINSAKKRTTLKRGGNAKDLEFSDYMLLDVKSPENILIVDELLTRLEDIKPVVAKVFAYRYYAKMTIDEIAELIEVSPATVKRHLELAKAWLKRKMRLDD